MRKLTSDRWKLSCILRAPVAWLTGAALTINFAGCISVSPADRHFDRGNYPAAASNYERQIEQGFLDEEETAQALYRLVLIYGMPDSPDWNRDKVPPLLERLRRDHPTTLYGVQAARILDSSHEIERLYSDIAKKQERIALLAGELANSQIVPEEAEPERSADEDRIARLTRTVSQLRGEIEALQIELAEQAAEFEQLKRIDLTTPP